MLNIINGELTFSKYTLWHNISQKYSLFVYVYIHSSSYTWKPFLIPS
jgi:hypothetical protein